MLRSDENGPRVVVVGPCASGKTTLVELLRGQGVTAYSAAQEHSNAPCMYLRHGPDFTVYLDVSYEEIRRRRSVSWGRARLRAQERRLSAARESADLVIDTDGLDPGAICERTLVALKRRGETCPTDN